MSAAYVGLRQDETAIKIDLLYRADAPLNPAHVLVPEGVDARDANWLVATLDPETQAVVISNDAERLSAAHAERLAEIRVRRDALLVGSDWTQVGDSPLDADAKAAWRTYRQALRDLPDAAVACPFDAVWPVAPA